MAPGGGGNKTGRWLASIRLGSPLWGVAPKEASIEGHLAVAARMGDQGVIALFNVANTKQPNPFR